MSLGFDLLPFKPQEVNVWKASAARVVHLGVAELA
jgi:hypothetical protein